MRRRRALLGLLSLLLVLSGCWDMRELEEANYVIAVGVDKGKKERLSVTFVLAGPHQVAASSEEGDKKSGNRITVEAPTVAGANAYLNTVVPRPTSLAQTKLIMVSEELVRSEGMVILDESSRSRTLRRSTMIVVTKQPVSKILDSLPPGPEGLNDFAFLQTSAEARRSGFLPVRTTLNDFLIRASTAYQEPVAYYAALVEPKPKEESGKPEEGAGKPAGGSAKQAGGSAKQEGGSAKPESQRRLVPGISRRKGGPAVDFFGAAAFRQTKMVGALDAQDTRAMLLVQNTFAQSTLDVVDPHAPDRTGAVRISTGRPTKVKVKLNNGRPQFEILITLEGEVIGMPALVDYTKSDMRDQLESHVAEEVKEQVETFFKKTQEWQSDVGGLGRYIVRKFPTVDAWHHFNWPNQYKDAQITVSVRMQLRRFGVQLSPQPSGSREKME